MEERLKEINHEHKNSLRYSHRYQFLFRLTQEKNREKRKGRERDIINIKKRFL
ncbi:hypothetical protein SERLA73DRAFT_145162, partial [Serpula lacrymans var. lacrymans S7.3]